ncbi:MAG: DNA polymerase III subunit gamma/tau [Hyphomicrobiaceae bacterium]|nr:DNA polymerase III subunit gamma/tau [Hyphomicrobiaceae bacterium]
MAKKSEGDVPPDGARAPAAEGAQKPYVVLARKYRPQTFDDLIGQSAMVTTLKNAFAADRIAQGYMLTGVRGVGKTTTARILSRALNYEREGVTRPTFDMPVLGRHCLEIMEGRHPDVLEMDAASNTGVDNIREIIESARYKPMVARTKVFLIDEVHMLSKGAFNALLKTLEEPPPHVKFIFATTEVRKVPVTVLSRTQRFDLRRVDVPELSAHFARIVEQEGARAEPEALALVARAAEGSVRDGLSLLDQAIAMGSGSVTAEQVRAMLGLADRGRIFDLIEHVFGGRTAEALRALEGLHRDGAEPQQVLADLADTVHLAMRVKIAGAEAAGEALSAEERRRASAIAERLSVPLLSRAWQMLLKGLEEISRAPRPGAAAEMVLIRLAYTADLPSPDELARLIAGGSVPARNGAAPPRAEAAPAARAPVAEHVEEPPPPQSPEEYILDADAEMDADLESLDDEAPRPQRPVPTARVLRSFQDVIDLVGERRDAKLKYHLEDHVSLVKFEPSGSIELHLLPQAPKELPNDLREKLNGWTERRWMVAVSKTAGEPPVGEVRRAREAQELAEIQRHPAVEAVLKEFPGAEITVRRLPGAKRDDTGTG